jgi:hypothetical protein
MKLQNFFGAAMALIMATQNVFAQYSSQLIVLKTPSKYLNAPLKHGGTIKVRAILDDLNPGDYVATLEVEVRGGQLGSKLELIADQNQIGVVDLFGQFRTETFQVKMRNGMDYNRLILRSIGASVVNRVTAIVADANSDLDEADLLPPLPPQPPIIVDQPPPVIVIQPPPTADPGVNQFNANCKTKSSGIIFYSQSEQGAFNLCNQAVGYYQTNSGECFAMTECDVPRMQCSTSSSNIPVIGYSRDSVVQKCSAHPVVIANGAINQCVAFARCEGSNNNGPVINPPQPPPPIFVQPGNNFDPNKPCQTKSNGYKFSAFTSFDVIEQCGKYAPQYTDRAICQGNAFCNGQQAGGNTHVGPGGHHGGGGHVGPLPQPLNRCINFSRGRVFPGQTFQQVLNDCRSNQPMTSSIDCDNNVYCSNFGPACISFSRNRPFYSTSGSDAAARCRSHPSTSNDECNQTARCY